MQWLCNEDKGWHNAPRRMMCFFQSLYNCLVRGAKAVIQLYPETPQQMELITSSAMRCGFTGGLVVDYPNSTKAKKCETDESITSEFRALTYCFCTDACRYFLCLCAGNAQMNYQVPAAKGVDVADGEDGDEKEAAGSVRFDVGRSSPPYDSNHFKSYRDRTSAMTCTLSCCPFWSL